MKIFVLHVVVNYFIYSFKINHPDSEDLAFLYGTILTDGKDTYNEEPTTNICVFAKMNRY